MHQLTQLDCATLPDFMKMITSMCQSVTRFERTHSNIDDREHKNKISDSTASLGAKVVVMSKIISSREIEAWEHKKFDLEMKTLNFNGFIHDMKRSLIGRSINELDEKIKDGKVNAAVFEGAKIQKQHNFTCDYSTLQLVFYFSVELIIFVQHFI